MKFSLVIQGPIISIGRKGGFNNEIVYYNCVDNISRIVKTYKDQFELIVLATWSNYNSYFAELNSLSNNFQIISLDESNISTLDSSSLNKYKQFYSSYIGAKYISDNSQTDYVIKIRTDQFIRIDRLLSEFINTINNVIFNENAIFIPLIYNIKNELSGPYIQDFYFIAKTKTILNFFYSIISFNFHDFVSFVHSEIYFKYSFNFNNSHFKLKDYIYFPRLNYYIRGHEKIERFMYSEIFIPLFKDIYNDIIWRGAKIDSSLVKGNYFYEEWISHNYKEQYLRKIPNENACKKINIFNFGIFINVNYLLYKNPCLRKYFKLILSFRFFQKIVELVYFQFNTRLLKWNKI